VFINTMIIKAAFIKTADDFYKNDR